MVCCSESQGVELPPALTFHSVHVCVFIVVKQEVQSLHPFTHSHPSNPCTEIMNPYIHTSGLPVLCNPLVLRRGCLTKRNNSDGKISNNLQLSPSLYCLYVLFLDGWFLCPTKRCVVCYVLKFLSSIKKKKKRFHVCSVFCNKRVDSFVHMPCPHKRDKQI